MGAANGAKTGRRRFRPKRPGQRSGPLESRWDPSIIRDPVKRAAAERAAEQERPWQ